MQLHHISLKILSLISVLFFIVACTSNSTMPGSADAATQMEPLVTTAWLSEHLDDADLVVLDCSIKIESDGSGGFRTTSGRSSYEAGHIPSAAFGVYQCAKFAHALTQY
ncbi:MAG: hypothetical protein VB957_11250 [Pseudomonadales bacterium]